MVEIEKPKHNYIFPNIMAQAMSKVDLRTQLEAGMMSMTFMLFGLIVSGIYIALYINFPLWYKIFLILNLFAGVILFISNLTTQYQQYLNYMEVMDFQKQEELKGGIEEENAKNNTR